MSSERNRGGVTNQQVVRNIAIRMNHILLGASPSSAMVGLERLARGLKLLAVTYAMPNPENPQGMCDDPQQLLDRLAAIVKGEV